MNFYSDENSANLAALLPAQARGTGRPIGDRRAWGEAGRWPTIRGLAVSAERYAEEPIPLLGEEQWKALQEKGDRLPLERAARLRTTRLNAFVIAEGLEDRGRYLPLIGREIGAILDEPDWAPTSARHDRSADEVRTEVSLSSAVRAWTLATADYWLGERLPAMLRERLLRELQERIFDPFLSADAARRFFWVRQFPNNWSAVCHAGVVGAALAILESREERAAILRTALSNIRLYLEASPFSSEGYCREGVGYWDYGFGNYLLLAETLWQNSGGKINLYEGERVRRIAFAVRQVEMSHGTYPAFADSPCYARPNVALLWLIARRFGLTEGQWPAEPDDDYRHYRPEWAFRDEEGRPDPRDLAGSMFALHSLGDRLGAYGIFAFPVPAGVANAREDSRRENGMRDWLDGPQIGVFRHFAAEGPAVTMAVKGGDNEEPHGHLDVGSYVICVDGYPLLLDPGAERYTASTFSAKRWESMMNNSLGHPVPRVAGAGQIRGLEARAEVIERTSAGQRDTLVMDLTRCYAAASLKRLWRTFVFDRAERQILISDEAEFSIPQQFGTALITNSHWQEEAAGTLRVSDRGGVLKVQTTTPAGCLLFTPEPVRAPAHRSGMQPVRLGYELEKPAAVAVIRSVITCQAGSGY